MSRGILLCTDLDGTLLPSGQAPESPAARPWLRRVVAQPGVSLVYATGRSRELVESATAEYGLPIPDYAICDVGASIWGRVPEGWQRLSDWDARIAEHWPGPERIQAWLEDLPQLSLQELEHQAPFKLSYYTPPRIARDALFDLIRGRLECHSVRVQLVWSLDPVRQLGLLDILPAEVSKLQALVYLMQRLGYTPEDTLYAGDSGNDLDVLVSPIPAILVANADPEVRAAALAQASARGLGDRLYCAQGGWRGLNGNYAAGILEGIAHFRPQLLAVLDHPQIEEAA